MNGGTQGEDFGYQTNDTSSHNAIESDHLLIEALCQSDETTWKKLIQEVIRPSLRTHRFHIKSQMEQYGIEPDSVISALYIKLSQNNFAVLRDFRHESKLSTYLYMRILDAAQQEIRKQTKGSKLAISESAFQEEGAPGYATLDMINNREELQLTRSLLLKLQQRHPLYYCVLCLRVLFNKTSYETAALLHKSVNNIDQILRRAQATLRRYRAAAILGNTMNFIYSNHTPKHRKNMQPKIQWKRRNNEEIRICMLMITHSCNLNCTYCYEEFKSAKKMDIELAKSIILKEVEYVKRHKNIKGLEIDFMGGEPLTNFPLIKGLVEWAESELVEVPFLFFITSNGTLFDDERKAWFREHRDTIVVGVSYDGTTEMQRKNRKTQDNQIDMDFFHETWPFQEFHMTISQDSLPHLAEGILEIQKKGYAVNAALAQGVEWNDKDASLYDEQLQLLEKAYLNDLSLPPINLLSNVINVKSSAEVLTTTQERFCGTGSGMITYDTDGKIYGCHMFSPIVLGSRAKELDPENPPCQGAFEDSYCAACVLKLNCPTCAGFNYRYRGDISKRDHRWCKMVYVQLKRACEFQIKAIATHLNSLGEYDASLAEQALKAYPILSADYLTMQKGPYLYTE